jgi:uncharacterized protein (DUF1015 family)
MAEIQPLRALHYDPAVAGPLADVTAPPYDVIDPEQRAALLKRSPHNIVAIDLPHSGPVSEGGPGSESAAGSERSGTDSEGALESSEDAGERATDPYAAAAALLNDWQREGAMVRDPEPAIWAQTQEYTAPDGRRLTRHGFYCRVRIEEYGPGRIRPHERTHPGPKQDRLRLTRATKANVSPIFSLYSDPEQAAWAALEPATAQTPWAEIEDGEGTVHRLWRVADPRAIVAVQDATREAELLIADGHHRYETMQAYAREVGGDGDHDYVLMCLVAIEDPGLTVFPTHRLIGGLDEQRRTALRQTLQLDFAIEEVPVEEIAPPDQPAGAPPSPLQLGYIDSFHERPLRLTLKDQAIADAALAGRSDAYRRLDTAVLETLLLRGALGYSEADISHLHGLFYARSTAEALDQVRTGAYDAAFFMRATPIAEVRDVAAAGENMPPKSTFFYPKLLTGLLLNPLA